MEIRSNEAVAASLTAEMRQAINSLAAAVPGMRSIDTGDVHSGHDDIANQLSADMRAWCETAGLDAHALRDAARMIAESDGEVAFALRAG